jgi:hypothetical protein
MAKFEKPQKKNRHILTINQHVFPLASIARFVGPDSRVSLHDLTRNKLRAAKPRDDIFCARRAWDQRAEAGYMKRIEDQFQRLASKVIEGAVSEIGETEKGVVNRFYALWYMRARQRKLPAQEIQTPALTGGNLTRDQEENLEINNYSFMRPGGKFLARQINGIQLQLLSARYANELQPKTRWGIIRAQAGEFIVPDVPVHKMVPLTPALYLISPAPTGTIVHSNLAEINRRVRAASHEYFFARDFASCPF